MHENYTQNSSKNESVLFDLEYIIETISNYFKKSSLKYSRDTGWWYLKGSHNAETSEVFSYSKAKHISFLYKKVWEKLGFEFDKYFYSKLLEIKSDERAERKGYKPTPIADISIYLNKISNVKYQEHFRIAGEFTPLRGPEEFQNFYKSLNITKKFSEETEKFLKEIFALNRFGDATLNMTNSIFVSFEEVNYSSGGYGFAFEPIPTKTERKNNLRIDRKAFTERKIFFHVDGTPNSKLMINRTANPLYYHIPRFLRLNNGQIINDQNKGTPIKYPKLKAPNKFFKTPTFVAYSDENRKNVDHIFLVEGMKDFASMIDIVLEKKIENFAIVLVLGVSEFPKIAKEFGTKFKSAKIHLIVDDDLAGEEAINLTYRKLSHSLRNRTDYLDWKKAILAKNRVSKNDITDYRNDGYEFQMEHLSTTFQFSKKDIEAINRAKSRSFYELIPEKDSVNLTQYLESEKGNFLKDSLLNGEKRIILQAPMGSGKSHVLKNWLPKEAQKLDRKEVNIVISPLKSLRDQLLESGEYQNIEALLYGVNRKNHQFFSISIQSLTVKKKREFFEMRLRYLQEDGFKINIWIDEAHIHSEISNNMRFIYQLEKELKIRLIQLSATAKLLFMRDWEKNDVQKFDVKLPKLRFHSLENIFCEKKSELTSATIKKVEALSGKIAIMINSDIESILIQEELKKIGRNPQIINALTKYQLNFEAFDTFIVTSITEFGLNFFGSNIDYIIGVGLSPFSLIQFAGRFRDRETAKIINIQKSIFSNVGKLKITLFPQETNSKIDNFKYDPIKESYSLHLEKSLFDKIIGESSFQKNGLSKHSLISKIIKKFLPDFQTFSIENTDTRKYGQITLYINTKGSNISFGLENFYLDKRGDNFDDILILKDYLRVSLNQNLFNFLIFEYIEIGKTYHIFIGKEQNIEKDLSEKREKLKDLLAKKAVSGEKIDNGVQKVRKIFWNKFPKLNSEIFYKNYFHKRATPEIYEKIIFAKSVLALKQKYGAKEFDLKIKTEILEMEKEKKSVSRDFLKYLATVGKHLSFYKKEAKWRSGVYTFPKKQRKFVTEISKYMEILESGEFEKFKLREFDMKLLENSDFSNDKDFFSKLEFSIKFSQKAK
jgi:hypothetical protein